MLLRVFVLAVAAITLSAFHASAGTELRDCTVCPGMVVVAAGVFLMGSPANETGRGDNEGPQHRVVISRRFAIGKFDVTREQYSVFAAATGRKPGDPKCDWANPKWRGEPLSQRDDEPVVCVTWADATAYAAWLSEKTHHHYRLPSEAEWEFAARAGSTTARPWGSTITRDDANYGADVCCGPATGGHDHWRFTSPVGSFSPNGFGLFDMIGNVWQWTGGCARDYAGVEPDDCDRHIVRGGGWFHGPDVARTASRAADPPGLKVGDIGFRVARDMD